VPQSVIDTLAPVAGLAVTLSDGVLSVTIDRPDNATTLTELDAALEREPRGQSVLLRSHDFIEGATAFRPARRCLAHRRPWPPPRGSWPRPGRHRLHQVTDHVDRARGVHPCLRRHRIGRVEGDRCDVVEPAQTLEWLRVSGGGDDLVPVRQQGSDQPRPRITSGTGDQNPPTPDPSRV
jgi:hypothetical protein